MTSPFQVAVVSCGPSRAGRVVRAERAGEVHHLTQVAFRGHETLDPPSGAGSETIPDLTLAEGSAMNEE